MYCTAIHNQLNKILLQTIESLKVSYFNIKNISQKYTAQYKHKGVELDIAGNISPSFMINTNYAFTDARVSKGDADQVGKKKIGTPDHSANLWLKYGLLNGKLKGFSFALGYQYMGRRSASNIDDPRGRCAGPP